MFNYVDGNISKNSVSRGEIVEVISGTWSGGLWTKCFAMTPSRRGNPRTMYVGFTMDARMLEVGVEYLPDDQELVFHASDATTFYRLKYEKDIGI